MQPSLEILSLQVTAVSRPTSSIIEIVLASPEGKMLPGFSAGAHISVRVPPEASPTGVELWRSYSLIHLDASDDPHGPRKSYRLGVRLEAESTGGSSYLHQHAKVGLRVDVRPPVNHFPMHDTDNDVVLVAGGIGVTPIATMMSELVRTKRKFVMHYSCRSADQLAFLNELRAVGGNAVRDYVDDVPERAFSLTRLFSACGPTQPIYICGPKGMIDAVFAGAKERGWDHTRLHAELFTSVEPQSGDKPFELVLKSGKVIQVPADRTALDVLTEAGHFVPYDCRAGYCGLCSVNVLGGEIDHRDEILSPEDKASGKIMQLCVSRAKSDRLFIDL